LAGVPIKAKYSFYWIYIFTDEEIQRVEVVSRLRLYAVVLIVTMIYVTGLVSLAAVANRTLPAIAVSFLAAGVLIVPLASALFYYSLLQRRVSALTPKEINERASTVRIPWNRITQVRLIRRLIKIKFSSHTYKVRLGRRDVSLVRELAKSKLGDKLIVSA